MRIPARFTAHGTALIELFFWRPAASAAIHVYLFEIPEAVSYSVPASPPLAQSTVFYR